MYMMCKKHGDFVITVGQTAKRKKFQRDKNTVATWWLEDKPQLYGHFFVESIYRSLTRGTSPPKMSN